MSRAGKGYKRHRSDSNQAAIVEVLRKMGKRVWIIGRPSDLLVLDGGRLHLVDTKRQGGTLTQAQQKAVDAGWPIRFVHSETEALALFSVGADRGRAQTEKVD